jgi:transcription termination/antitermination protein NusG
MDFWMGADQESECRATQPGSPTTLPNALAPASFEAGPELRTLPEEAGTAECAVASCVQVRQRHSASALNWYVVYTSANHEKRVAEQFLARGIAHFLPQYESIRKWKDRKVRLHLPLFPGYVFVQMDLAKRLGVLQVPGVARLVGFDGQPAPVPEEDLLRVREFLAQGFRAEPHRLLKIGRRVRVKTGPLAGMEGIVARRKNGHKVVIAFDLIQQAMAVEIAGEGLEAL